MTIYIDSDYKCYASVADGRRAVETNFFDGKCSEWIESYRFVPAGETWTREDGKLYLCKRTGEAAGGTVVLQYLPHELVGNYFVEVI